MKRTIFDLLVLALIVLFFVLLYTEETKLNERKKIPTVEIKSKEIPERKVNKTLVKATFYNATPGQCDGQPNCTYSGFKLNMWNPYSHRIIAVSRDLLKKGFKMGMKIYLRFPKGAMACYDGVWIVKDLMGGGSTNMIDLLVNVDMPMAITKYVELITIEK